jgi:hypothetical protein
MSEMVMAGIERYAHLLEARLFASDAPRFIIAVSEVVDSEAARATQGPLASRLGREQLLMMARGDDSWAASALRAVVFDTGADSDATTDAGTHRLLTRERFRDASYASTRMLHAWRLPASVDGTPFIDASYTDGFPVRAVMTEHVRTIVAIATSHGLPYTNLYRTAAIGSAAGGVRIEHIAPRVDLKELGVDYTTASREGLTNAYEHGHEVALGWIASHDGAF